MEHKSVSFKTKHKSVSFKTEHKSVSYKIVKWDHRKLEKATKNQVIETRPHKKIKIDISISKWYWTFWFYQFVTACRERREKMC